MRIEVLTSGRGPIAGPNPPPCQLPTGCSTAGPKSGCDEIGPWWAVSDLVFHWLLRRMPRRCHTDRAYGVPRVRTWSRRARGSRQEGKYQGVVLAIDEAQRAQRYQPRLPRLLRAGKLLQHCGKSERLRQTFPRRAASGVPRPRRRGGGRQSLPRRHHPPSRPAADRPTDRAGCGI